MNLNQLYYFRKLAELEHYTKAAEHLYISQPSLSAAIASIEKELEAQFFIRQGRNVQLTKQGKLFYEYVVRALDTLNDGISVLNKEINCINICCIPTLASDFLMTKISEYRKSSKEDFSFDINIGVTSHVIQGIHDGNFDLGLCSFEEDQPDLVFLPVKNQQIVAVLPMGHALAQKKELKLADMAQFPIISYRDDIPIGKTIQRLFKDRGLKLELSHAVDGEIALGAMVEQGFGIGIAAKTSLLQLYKLDIVPLDVEDDARMVYLTYHKGKSQKRVVQGLIEYILRIH